MYRRIKIYFMGLALGFIVLWALNLHIIIKINYLNYSLLGWRTFHNGLNCVDGGDR